MYAAASVKVWVELVLPMFENVLATQLASAVRVNSTYRELLER